MASAHHLQPFVERLNRHSSICPEDQEALFSIEHSARAVSRGTYLVHEGDEPDACRLISCGFLYRHKLTHHGSREIVSIHLSGEIVDVQNSFLNVADHNVQALTEAEVVLIPRPAMRRLILEHPAIARALLIESLIDASILREWLLNVSRRPSRARLAHLLCEIALRLKAAGLIEGQSYRIPMIQEEIADCLGMTQIHLSRMFSSLEKDGAVERERRTISIVDWDKLASIGEFNERYLHLYRADANPAPGCDQ